MITGGQRVVDQPFLKDDEWSERESTIRLGKYHMDGGTQWGAAGNQSVKRQQFEKSSTYFCACSFRMGVTGLTGGERVPRIQPFEMRLDMKNGALT